MLTGEELRRVADRFGVDDAQVVRDHFIGHALAGIAATAGEDVVFIGGTALARTHLPEGRLSEDIDLIAVGHRGRAAQAVETGVLLGVRREYPGSTWVIPLTTTRGSRPGVVRSREGVTVRVQLLTRTGYPVVPTEARALVTRYADTPATVLRVPAVDGFVVLKLLAWCDRAAPRDLFDLAGLARRGAFTEAAGDLFRQVGPTNRRPDAALFTRLPDDNAWQAALAHQTARVGSPQAAAALVRTAVAASVPARSSASTDLGSGPAPLV